MKRARILLFLAFTCTAADQQFSLARAERAAESELVASFGVTSRPPLEHPYALPFSNRSLIVPQAWFREAVGERRTGIGADSLRQDLPLLRAVMAKAYAGWRIAAGRGWNWTQWFENWDHLLARREGQILPVEEALAPITEFQDFQRDNASGPVTEAQFGGGSRSAILLGVPGGVCVQMRMRSNRFFAMDPNDPGQQPRRALLADLATSAWYFSYPASRGDVSALRCAGRWIAADPVWEPRPGARGRNILEISHLDRDAPAFRFLTPDISYLRAPTGDRLNQERMRNLIEALPRRAGRERLLIWDLRSNGGGDRYALALKRWLDPAKVDASAMPRSVRRSCLSVSLQWNSEWFGLSGIKPPVSDEIKSGLQALADGVARGAPGCPDTVDAEKSDWNYSQRKFPEKVRYLVLVDNRCGAECEAMVYALASEPGTVVAGTNTYGACQYVVSGSFVLPHSRLAFRTALGATHPYGDNRSVDGYGLDVDVLLRTPEEQSAAGILKLAELLAARGPS